MATVLPARIGTLAQHSQIPAHQTSSTGKPLSSPFRKSRNLGQYAHACEGQCSGGARFTPGVPNRHPDKKTPGRSSSLTPGSGGKWTEATLYDFKGGSDAFAPYAGLSIHQSGNLYGTTIIGGGTGCYGVGCGTVFELSPASDGWTETVLYSFTGGGDGSRPQAGLLLDSAGNLYGTSTQGGNLTCGSGSGCGVVFELMLKSDSWRETVLYRFKGGIDGADPYTGVLLGKEGNLYGTTAIGGGKGCGGTGCGTVFELTPTAGWKERILYRFKGGTDGAGPSWLG